MVRTIEKLLVANRGEIALRVMRTCKAMGIATVAVYSDADADAPFVRFADEAVRIGPPPPRESYLVINHILDAARVTGADAIHPGYGFLSENARFAEAVHDAELVFVGPPSEVIAKLGSKQEAKRLAERAGVPTVPGYHGDDQDGLAEHARRLGFPLLVKASAGGGGKGMRVVRRDDELADAIERARGEALSAFGDGTLLLERYVERPRHIEIQILGDRHGDVVHLWERECSIQRRHQKIVEEAPSPALDDARRAAMGRAAVELGRAVDYVGAGTVEFIVDPSGAFYFLEVNTRLQVEHPVTELTTGLDLVREQIRIARGERLGYASAPPQRGWAIEVRLCAEDADRDYLPTTGTLLAVDVPPAIRADIGVAVDSQIGIHYDSMLGKLIAHAPTRGEAAQVLRRALDETWVPGVITNREQLSRILGHPAFLAGELDTHFLEHHAGDLAARAPGLDRLRVAAIAATLHGIVARRGTAALASPGWRNVRFADQRVDYKIGEADVEVAYRAVGDRIELSIGGKTTTVGPYGLAGDRLWFVESPGFAGARSNAQRCGDEIESPGFAGARSNAQRCGGEIESPGFAGARSNAQRCGDEIESPGFAGARSNAQRCGDEIEHGRHRRTARVAVAGDRVTVLADGYQHVLVEQPRFAEHGHAVVGGGLTAPMPGKVVKVLVAIDQEVIAGAPLVVLEAMKMEHTVRAGGAGVVRAIHVSVGDQVETDHLLAVVTE